jgi:hypothetical protein
MTCQRGEVGLTMMCWIEVYFVSHGGHRVKYELFWAAVLIVAYSRDIHVISYCDYVMFWMPCWTDRLILCIFLKVFFSWSVISYWLVLKADSFLVTVLVIWKHFHIASDLDLGADLWKKGFVNKQRVLSDTARLSAKFIYEVGHIVRVHIARSVSRIRIRAVTYLY